MTFKRIYLLRACLCCIIALHSTTAKAQTVIVGNTLQFVKEDKYIPLPHAKIQAFRGGTVFAAPASSDDNGHFEVVVPSGGPFNLIFYLDNDRMPELQELAGVVAKHIVFVALLKVRQYQEFAARRLVPALSARLECLQQALPEDSEAHRVVQEITANIALDTPPAKAQTVVVGNTLQLVNKDRYVPLPHAKIQAFRGGTMFPSPALSDDNGHFKVVIPSGGPFNLIFYLDNDTIPELQELAGISSQHAVYVSLLKVSQYRDFVEQRLVPPLRFRLQCLLEWLPEGSEAWRVVQEMKEENPE